MGKFHTFPSGWTDDNLMAAYDAVYLVKQRFAELGMAKAFDRVLVAIEDLDGEIQSALDDSGDPQADALRDIASAIISAERRVA